MVGYRQAHLEWQDKSIICELAHFCGAGTHATKGLQRSYIRTQPDTIPCELGLKANHALIPCLGHRSAPHGWQREGGIERLLRGNWTRAAVKPQTGPQRDHSRDLCPRSQVFARAGDCVGKSVGKMANAT